MNIKRMSFPLDVRAVGEKGEFEGYGSVFGEVDWYSEVVAPGAFEVSLAKHKSKGTMPALLWQHMNDEPIGKWVEMVEDEHGLKCKGHLLVEADPLAKRAHAHLKAKSISGLSIGFVPVRRETNEDTGITTLLEVDLWEVSLVTFPANEEARVSDVKAIENISTVRDAEAFLRESKGFTRSEALAFVGRVKAAALRDAAQKATIEAANKTLNIFKGDSHA